MKLKNVKKGVVVEAKVDIDDVVPKGAQGVLIESDSNYPYVSWKSTLIAANNRFGYGNVWAVNIEEIRMVKDEDANH